MALDYPNHSIVQNPLKVKIEKITISDERVEKGESFLDVSLYDDGQYKRLRFFSPQDIKISGNFMNPVSFVVSDLSNSGMEGISVRVSDYEMDAISFYAKSVANL